ncbi:NACHT domain-containing protein [Streptomyces sp. HD]|uniref:NACHT domain-containing protein n=1 Tax=Streptomyces sp. HD TaxID=3020892 RepID=UPI00232F285D|nr:XRE family transcriptional regulator [Streptomyces sp. HD]MDC0772734.1 helix-turn-helix domain-containing protein [Streptomyces sp. HD]
MADEFGKVLRRLRERAGMTQERLAEASGVSVATIRRLETGRASNPRMNTVQDLADGLGLGPEEPTELLEAAFGKNDDPRPPDPLDGPAEQLANLVAARWRREEEQRRVQDPFPLQVRWKTVPESLIDHWATILRPAKAGTDPLNTDPLDLDGRLEQIAAVFRKIPSRRLVVLGKAGSGKTILTLRFVLDYLTPRDPADPVPVIFSIGAWNPTAITLRDWLADRLTRDHPGYAAPGPGGESLATALVESGRVLPVLDGFDEMARGLRRPALEALNAFRQPLLLTSRPDEYTAAVAETDVLTAAAAIELTDLTLDDLAAYLPLTTRKTGGAKSAKNVWSPVLTALRKQPSSPLATVLKTPLMVSLARTIYSDTPDHDPADLLKTEHFGSPAELEDHLLDNFVPVVYRPRHDRSPAGGPRRDFDPERARHWLGHLARLNTSDLAWWRLDSGLRRSTRTLVTALTTGLVIGLVDFVASLGFGAVLKYALMDATVVALLSGLVFGLMHWLTFTVKDKQVTPSAVRLSIRGRPAALHWTAGPRLVLGSLGGLVFGFGYGFLFIGMMNADIMKVGSTVALHLGLANGIVFGLIFSGAAGLTFCLLGLLETPFDIDSAGDPRSLLNANRRTVITQLLVWAPAFGVAVGFGSVAVIGLLQDGPLGSLSWSLRAGLVSGLVSGLCGALGFALTLTAWGQWLVLARIWLPLTGHLPWTLVTFLDDAYRRGVLRQAGAVYQFRHARLQHHLAQAHPAHSAPEQPGGRSRAPHTPE